MPEHNYMTDEAIDIIEKMWYNGDSWITLAAILHDILGIKFTRNMVMDQVRNRGFVRRVPKYDPVAPGLTLAEAARARKMITILNDRPGGQGDRVAITGVRYPVPPGGFTMLGRR